MGFLRRFLSYIAAVTSARPAFIPETSGQLTAVCSVLPTVCLAAFQDLLQAAGLQQPEHF